MSSARNLFVAALSVMLLLLSASLLSAQTADETWFGAAVLRGSYLYPRATGIILFGQAARSGEVRVFIQVDGMPDGVYALHVHQWGDLTSSLGSKNISTAVDGVGIHMNPFNSSHGCDMPGTFATKHVGDIGNYTNKAGASNEFVSQLMDLSYTNRSIIGRSVIIHESYDHCVQPTGNAGVPILQGVIGIANPYLNAWFSKLPNMPTPTATTKNLAALPLVASAVTDPNVQYGITTAQSAVATMYPLGKTGVVQQPVGVVRFGPMADNTVGANVAITIRYLTPNTTHGIHVHAFGDDFDGSFSPYTPTPGHYNGTDNFANAGSHWNPYGVPHGLPENGTRHEGDLGNIVTDANGNVDLVIQSTLIDFLSANTSIIGHCVIVHALPDDGGQPTGNAGNRVLAGIIGLSNNNYQTNLKSDFTPFPVPPPTDETTATEEYALVAAVVVAILVVVLIAAMYVRYSYVRYDKFMECCDCGGCLRFYCGGKAPKPDESTGGYGTLQD